MKKLLLLVLPVAFLTLGLLTGCSDDENNPVSNNTTKYGSLYLKSIPAGAKILLNGTATTKVTPAKLDSLDVSKTYSIGLVVDNYDTLKFNYNATDGKTDTLTKELNSWYYTFTSDTIWESNAPGKSGLSLSLGTVLSAVAANAGTVDLYYSTSSYKLVSANLGTNLTRVTAFKVATGTNLSDGVDSPVKDGTWTDRIADNGTTYAFAYDQDHHYSKIQVIANFVGTTGHPSWVIVKWIYNRKVDNVNF